MHDSVLDRGHAMRYLAPTLGSAGPTSLQTILQRVELARADAVLRVQVRSKHDQYFLRWPKDGIQCFGKFVAVANAPVMRRVARALGIAQPLQSRLCEGGLMLRIGDVLIQSAAAQRRVHRELSDRYRMLVLPSPSYSPNYRRQHPLAPTRNPHLDLDCAVVENSYGTRHFLVSELYFGAHRAAVRRVADTIGAQIYVAPVREVDQRVLNLVTLPGGDVLIPANCTQTQEFLESALGKAHVIAVSIDEDFNYNGGIGGLGCMCSVVSAVVDPKPRRRVV